MKPLQLVKVRWWDSHGVDGEWHPADDVPPLPPLLISTVGYVTDDQDSHITLAQNITMGSAAGELHLSGRMTIPRCSIKSITDLEHGSQAEDPENRQTARKAD